MRFLERYRLEMTSSWSGDMMKTIMRRLYATASNADEIFSLIDVGNDGFVSSKEFYSFIKRLNVRLGVDPWLVHSSRLPFKFDVGNFPQILLVLWLSPLPPPPYVFLHFRFLLLSFHFFHLLCRLSRTSHCSSSGLHD